MLVSKANPLPWNCYQFTLYLIFFTLCSYTPELKSSPMPPVAVASSGGVASNSGATPLPSVPIDPSQPTTSLQIRLADGRRLTAKFNHSHTVNDIRQFINLYPESVLSRLYQSIPYFTSPFYSLPVHSIVYQSIL